MNNTDGDLISEQVTISAKEAAALPMPPHHVTRDEDGRPTVTCGAPPLAKCRVVCAESCESEVWPCGGYEYDDADQEIEREPHRMTDGGYCVVVLYWDDDFDGCAEDDAAARSYVGPVTAVWDDDTYVWSPVKPAPNDGSHAHG